MASERGGAEWRPHRSIAAGDWVALNGVNHVKAVNDLAEYAVAAVEVRCGGACDEKLRAIRVWACVGHRQHALALVLVLMVEVLVRKLLTVDGLACVSAHTKWAALGDRARVVHRHGRPRG